MAYDIVIKNGTVVSSQGQCKADIGIVGTKIAKVGDIAEDQAQEVIDALGKHVFPGVIDTQVHFREPGNEHKEDLESGSRAAIAGGVTSFFDMPNTNPATTTKQALEHKLSLAAGRCWANYAFYIGASPDNVDALAELERLPGCAGVKIFMGSSTGTLLVDDEAVLERVLMNGSRPCAVHSEDEARLKQRKPAFENDDNPANHPVWRDVETAVASTRKLFRLAGKTGRKVHLLHVSTADELALIETAKSDGLSVTAEVTPQHLFFYAPDCYESLGTLAQMNPPIRDSWHQMALRKATGEGLFDIVGSDHAPHTLAEKAMPYPKSPSGMPGVQTMLPVMLDLASEGVFSVEDVARMLCENPARIFGIKGKGFIEEGFDADIVVVDLCATRIVSKDILHSKCGWSPYEGEALTGWPTDVIVNGSLAVREGQVQGVPRGMMLEFEHE